MKGQRDAADFESEQRADDCGFLDLGFWKRESWGGYKF